MAWNPDITVEKGIPVQPTTRGGSGMTKKLMEWAQLMDPGDSFKLPIERAGHINLVRTAFKRAGVKCEIRMLEKPNGIKPGYIRVWRAE